eukprot:2661745-Prorocentrum_lima.AAC.1
MPCVHGANLHGVAFDRDSLHHCFVANPLPRTAIRRSCTCSAATEYREFTRLNRETIEEAPPARFEVVHHSAQ